DAPSRARGGLAAREAIALEGTVAPDRAHDRWRIPVQGTHRRGFARGDPSSLVHGHAAHPFCRFAPPGSGSSGLPPRRRAVVRPGRAAQPGIPAVLLHPRAFPALRLAGLAAAGARLLFRSVLSRGLCSGGLLLLFVAEERVASGRGRLPLLPDLVRSGPRLLLSFEEQATAVFPAGFS